MRASSSLSLLLLSLCACAPMDDPGSPWEPVPVASQHPVGGVPVQETPEVLPVPDPMFDVPEVVVIHSSELGQALEAPQPVHAGTDDAVASEPEPTPPVPVADQPVAPLPPGVQGFPPASASVASSWPLRLVATVPGAQPPRAILGLPGGAEVVVTPGTMLPDAGVVVMAIGTGSIELAEVRPAGDHAVVSGLTLEAQHSQRVELGAMR